MNLTAENKKQLAKEARRLAMRCVKGTAPTFTENSYCGCAVGLIMKKVLGFSVPDNADEDRGRDKYELAVAIDRHLPDGCLGVVSRAIQSQPGNHDGQQSAVVFPLLALADELEAAARSAPEKSP